MNLTTFSKKDLLTLELLIGKIGFLFLLNLRMSIIENLKIGAGQITILTHQVLTI
jgi:hypothetical protein